MLSNNRWKNILQKNIFITENKFLGKPAMRPPDPSTEPTGVFWPRSRILALNVISNMYMLL